MAANIELTDLKELQKTLSYKFKNEAILAQALTHKSYANETVMTFGHKGG